MNVVGNRINNHRILSRHEKDSHRNYISRLSYKSIFDSIYILKAEIVKPRLQHDIHFQ